MIEFKTHTYVKTPEKKAGDTIIVDHNGVSVIYMVKKRERIGRSKIRKLHLEPVI